MQIDTNRIGGQVEVKVTKANGTIAKHIVVQDVKRFGSNERAIKAEDIKDPIAQEVFLAESKTGKAISDEDKQLIAEAIEAKAIEEGREEIISE